MELATTLNRVRGPDHRVTTDNWLSAREEIARGIARCVGRLRKELGIRDTPYAFCAEHRDHGTAAVRLNGRVIPIERR